jgi:hypothetical protein
MSRRHPVGLPLRATTIPTTKPDDTSIVVRRLEESPNKENDNSPICQRRAVCSNQMAKRPGPYVCLRLKDRATYGGGPMNEICALQIMPRLA